MKNYIKIPGLLIALALIFNACADLEVENMNEPDAERALANPEDLASLLQGATTRIMFDQTDLWTTHVNMMSDQTTSTNAYLSFWQHADQPRRPLSNFSTYDDLVIYTATWNDANSAISTANIIINSIIEQGMEIPDDQGNDITSETLAAAYFIRGVAQSAIGLLYDQGYVVDETTDLGTLELQPYSEVVNSAIASFEKTLSIINAENTSWLYFPTKDYTAAEFKALVNSYAARTLMNYPRTPEEAAANDYAKILNYANNGITSDFMPSGQDGVIWHNVIDWEQYLLGDGAAYLPKDQKIPWLFDPANQPKNYPTDETVLPPAQTADERHDLYFNYDKDFGYLRADRGRHLWSNYALARYPNLGNDYNYNLSQIPYFLEAEIRYIKAEANLWQGNNDAALTLINEGPRKTVGGLANSADNSTANIKHLLHYEYSIELDNTTKGLQLYFMRRHDLLQKGTAMHFPVPVTELQLLGLPVYTYGGEANADGVNTADGVGSWNN